jgi:hypothetical protein
MGPNHEQEFAVMESQEQNLWCGIGHLIVCQLWWEEIIGPMNEIDDTAGFSLGPVTMYTKITQ